MFVKLAVDPNVQTKTVDEMSYKKIHQLLKRKNPKIHIGHAMEKCKMDGVDAKNKKWYFNAMQKAGERSDCQIQNHSLKMREVNESKKEKMKHPEALNAFFSKMPDNFKKRFQSSSEKKDTEEKQIESKLVNDGFLRGKG